ncbi:hypothetical protein SDJN02_26543, partial [Cucurbita argyrosperma subsp. argyrosperma]
MTLQGRDGLSWVGCSFALVNPKRPCDTKARSIRYKIESLHTLSIGSIVIIENLFSLASPVLCLEKSG